MTQLFVQDSVPCSSAPSGTLALQELTDFQPFGHELEHRQAWPEQIAANGRSGILFALLDTALQPGLVEFLENSGTRYRCLFSGDVQLELADVSPWLVALDPSDRFTQNLFTQSDAPYHFWGNAPGVLLLADAAMDDLWRWCRKALWVTDQDGTRYFLRWWDPTCLDVTLPILKALDAKLAVRDFDVTILVPSAWRNQS